MNRRFIVLATAILALALFGAAYIWHQNTQPAAAPTTASVQSDELVRAHSPIIGKADAPVTIVEFLDPSCEACRAFYPIVKQMMGNFPDKVRLVIRYTPFHEGSDEAVRILEAARMQNVFEPVLEELLRQQPVWADHGRPDMQKAWEIAGTVGLNIALAKEQGASDAITQILEMDKGDVKRFNIQQTPTFFVNGKPLENLGAKQLYELIGSAVKNQP